MRFLGSTAVPGLAVLTQRGQKKLSGHHLYKNLHSDLDLLPRDLKINREHLRFMYTLKQMGQKILSRQSLVYRPTKRLTGAKQNTLFLKGGGGGINNSIFLTIEFIQQ